jgi:hypothetical protein
MINCKYEINQNWCDSNCRENVLSLTIKWFAIVVFQNINLIKIQVSPIPLIYVIRIKSEENNAIIKEHNV